MFIFADPKAASFEFQSTEVWFKSNCVETLHLYIDPMGKLVDAADVKIVYNPAHLELIDANLVTPNFDIVNGNAFKNLYAVKHDSILGSLEFGGDSDGLNISSKSIFASVKLKNLNNVKSTNVSIYFTSNGDTLDSNIASAIDSTDLLSSVKDVKINFSDGQCDFTDVTPPSIFLLTPQKEQSSLKESKEIVLSLVDDFSGIDLSTLSIYVNGKLFKSDSPEVEISGTPSNYSIKLYSLQILEDTYGPNVKVEVFVKDFAGNQGQKVFNFSGQNDSTSILSIFAGLDLSKLKPILGFIGATLGIASSVLSIITGFNFGWLTTNLIGLFLTKNRRPWGVVLDMDSNKPIPLATCRLFIQNSLELISTTLTNLDGTYGFVLKSGGKYRLEVSKESYNTFSVNIDTPEDSSGFVYDVYLSKNDSKYSGFVSSGDKKFCYLRSLVQFIRNVLFFLGFFLSLFALSVYPVFFNYLVVFLYLLIFIVIFVYKLSSKNKFSVVVDSVTGDPVPYSVIKVYDLKQRKYIDTIVAGSDGTFDYFGKPGRYGILVMHRGYKFPSSKQLNDFELVEGIYSSMFVLDLKRGRNKYKILLDPVLKSFDNTSS